jgi:type I restriction enzyme, S subunit
MSKLKPHKTYQPIQYDYVSQLPVGWQLLPNIAIFQERIERGFDNEELLSVTIGKGVIRQSEVDIKKDSSNEDKSKYKLIKVGDIAYNRMRMWQGALGYSNYQGITSPAYVILKPKKEINQRFFHYMFRAGFYTNYSKRFSYGIVDDQLSLRYVDFKRMYSIFPPLETQNTIVEYLDRKTEQTQVLVAKKERLIDELRERELRTIELLVTKGLNSKTELKQSESTLFGEIPQHWQYKRLRFVASKVKTGTTPSSKKKDYFENEEFDWFTPGDFNETLELINASRKLSFEAIKDKEISVFPENSVLIIGIGGTTGKVGLIRNEASSNQQINSITFNKRIIPEYGLHLLAFVGRNLLDILDYTTLPILNQTATKNLPFLEPPVDEQEMIIGEIQKVRNNSNRSVQIIRKEIANIKEYQESLITQIVTGQLKVPDNINANLSQNNELGMVAEPDTSYKATN